MSPVPEGIKRSIVPDKKKNQSQDKPTDNGGISPGYGPTQVPLYPDNPTVRQVQIAPTPDSGLDNDAPAQF